MKLLLTMYVYLLSAVYFFILEKIFKRHEFHDFIEIEGGRSSLLLIKEYNQITKNIQAINK